jgi:subtilisin family serine protease
MRPDPYSTARRRADYDTCEERLALAAQSPAPLLATWAADAPHAQYGALAPTAQDAHALDADLAYIREKYDLRGVGQTVAVIDSGIAYDHVALGAGFGAGHRVVGGWDFAEDDANPYDDAPAGFHGTLVAGVIGSDDATHPGAATGVDFVALRVFDDQGGGGFARVAQALQWVHEHRESFRYPITTVNLSVGANLDPGNTPPLDLLEPRFAQLKADGIFVAVAAGNAFENTNVHGLSYPAASQCVVPVASLNDDGQLSTFSQRDSRILAAPGEHVTSTVPSHLFGGGGIANDFAYAHGTSLATPYVAGASVLVREALQEAGYADITQDTIETHLRQTADSFVDAQTDQTYLRMNIRRAVDSLLAAPAHGSEPTPPLTRLGDALQVAGTAADNTFELHIGTTLQLVINGVACEVPAAEVRSLDLQGAGGRDSLTVWTDAGDYIATLHPGALELTGATLLVKAEGVAVLELHGGAGFNTAYLHDSPGDETFRAQPNHVELQGPDFAQRVERFGRVYVTADSGGHDVAYLYDSAASDHLSARPESTSLTGQGFLNQATGFRRVYAYSQAGGEDVASLYDSAANDRFTARPEYAVMTGQGYANQAAGFARVTAYASIGDDQAQLYDSAGDDRFHAYPRSASFSGPNRQVSLRDFPRVTAYAQAGGEDRAFFNDSPGNDRFQADPTAASLSGDGFLHDARGFAHVFAYSTSGQDTALLTGSFQDDVLASRGAIVELSQASVRLTTDHFSTVQAEGGGGVDVAVFQDVGQADTFYGRQAAGTVRGADGDRAVHDFEEVTLRGHLVDADIDALDYLFRQISDA